VRDVSSYFFEQLVLDRVKVKPTRPTLTVNPNGGGLEVVYEGLEIVEE
jgi:hypothetical protein